MDGGRRIDREEERVERRRRKGQRRGGRSPGEEERKNREIWVAEVLGLRARLLKL